MGTSETSLFKIEPASPGDPPEWSGLGPSKVVYFVVGTQPLVLAVAQYTGGSDCAYVPILVGASKKVMKSLLQQEPLVNSQGGLYVGDLGEGRGFGLAAWTFIWEDGAHYGRHRYRVRLYRIDAESGTSKLIFKADTKKSYAEGDAALKEFGFQFKNVLKASSELGY